MKNNIIIGIIVLAILGLAGYKLVQNKKVINKNEQPIDRSNVPISVTAFEANYFPVSTDYALPGILEQNKVANINAVSPGKIVSLNLEIGQHVSKGQLVGKVDTRLKEIALKSTDVTIKKLETDAQRTEDLIKGDAAPATSILDINYNLESQKIQKENIKQQIADNNIYAPISGIITQKNLNEGEFVNPGTAIATIMDIATLKAVVFVSENNVYETSAEIKIE